MQIRAEKIICGAMRAVPIPLVNIVLSRLTAFICNQRPGIFSRLSGHSKKRFVIDPSNLPFVFLLKPNPQKPELQAFRRNGIPRSDARISGSFLTLLGMVDGRYDGDALFFTRDIRVEGDTEAIVCLRNALDDMDGSVADDIAAYFGRAGNIMLGMTRNISNHIRKG